PLHAHVADEQGTVKLDAVLVPTSVKVTIACTDVGLPAQLGDCVGAMPLSVRVPPTATVLTASVWPVRLAFTARSRTIAAGSLGRFEWLYVPLSTLMVYVPGYTAAVHVKSAAE